MAHVQQASLRLIGAVSFMMVPALPNFILTYIRMGSDFRSGKSIQLNWLDKNNQASFVEAYVYPHNARSLSPHYSYSAAATTSGRSMLVSL